MAKNRAISTPSPMTNEEDWKIVASSLTQIEASLETMKSMINAQIPHANTILVDLQRRVSALEQRQGMGETKRVTKVRQAKH